MQIRTSTGHRGYAYGCAQITRYGTASSDRRNDLVAEHNGGSARVLYMTTRITQRDAGTGRGRSGQRRPPTSWRTELQPMALP